MAPVVVIFNIGFRPTQLRLMSRMHPFGGALAMIAKLCQA